MALAHVASAGNIGITDINLKRTLAINVGTGSNRGLFVAVAWDDTETISSVTYAGVAMNLEVNLEAFTTRNTSIYSLANPTSGLNNVVVTMSAGAVVGTGATALTDVNQTNPGGTTGSNSVDNQTGVSQAITTTTDNSWIFAALNYENGTGTPAVDTGQTERFNLDGTGVWELGSTSETTTAGSYTDGFNWSPVVAQEGVMAMVEVIPAVTTVSVNVSDTITLTESTSLAVFYESFITIQQPWRQGVKLMTENA